MTTIIDVMNAMNAANDAMNVKHSKALPIVQTMNDTYANYVAAEKREFISRMISTVGADTTYLNGYLGMTFDIPSLVYNATDKRYELDNVKKKTVTVSDKDIVLFLSAWNRKVSMEATLNDIATHVATLKVTATYGRDDVNGEFPEVTIGSVQKELDNIFSAYGIKFDRKDIRSMVTACSISIVTDKKSVPGYKLSNRANIRGTIVKIANVRRKHERKQVIHEMY